MDHEERHRSARADGGRSPSSRRADRAQVWLFVLLAYGLAWAWWLPLMVGGDRVATGRGWPTHLIGLMGPAVAAVVATGVYEGRAGLADLAGRCVRWRVDRRVYLIVVVTLVAGLVPPLVTGTDLAGFGRYSGAPTWGPLMVLWVLLVNGYGEEVGWRGFLWDHLRTRHGFRRTAIIVWAVWGLWHLPLFWIVVSFGDMGPVGAVGWAVSLFFGTLFLGWLYEFSGRSVFAVVIWHVSYNFGVATDATSQVGAAVVSMGVILAGVLVMRARGDEGPTRSAPQHR